MDGLIGIVCSIESVKGWINLESLKSMMDSSMDLCIYIYSHTIYIPFINDTVGIRGLSILISFFILHIKKG